MAMTVRILSAIWVLTALGGGCTPSFEADLTDVEVTQRGVKVAAAPSCTPAGDISVTTAFTLSSSDGGWAKSVNTEVLVHHVGIALGGSLPSLDFITSARSTVAADASPGNATEIMDYVRNESSPSGTVIDVDLPAPVDITIPWSADKTVIEIELVGRLPTLDWTIDVSLGLSGKIAYRY